MKKTASVFLMVAVAALLIISTSAQASKMDRAIESSAQQSYAFKIDLKSDDIKVRSMDGTVTLTGSVSEKSHKSLAQETVAALPDVKSVDNRLVVKEEYHAEKPGAGQTAKGKTMLLLLMYIGSK